MYEMMDGTYQLNRGGCFGDRVHSFLDFIDHGEVTLDEGSYLAILLKC